MDGLVSTLGEMAARPLLCGRHAVVPPTYLSRWLMFLRHHSPKNSLSPNLLNHSHIFCICSGQKNKILYYFALV
jgi:hypothetical protein